MSFKENKSDEYETPFKALNFILPYVPLDATIWDPTNRNGHDNIINFFKEKGFKTIGTSSDFLTQEPPKTDNIIIITNPPFSLKNEFLKRCYDLSIPFMLLMPLIMLESKKRSELYKKNGLQLLLIPTRIEFVKKKKITFNCSWFCNKITNIESNKIIYL
jgi:hypothetical protein